LANSEDIMTAIRITAAVAALVAATGVAAAQNYPTRPITMVVAYVAGGPVDTLARIFGQRLSEVLGQSVVIENIGGAGGMVGASRVAKATPDGYTMLFGGLANLAQNQTLYKAPLYNAATDFAPVPLLTDSPRVLITRKDFPANTLAEFMAYVKANQAKLQYGSPGGGSSGHVCMIVLDTVMGTKITHVPYRGAAPAMQDMLGGRLDYMAEQISTAFPQIESGNVKAIAMLGLDRVSVLPNLPTAHESGLTNFDCSAWSALVLPLRTPEAIVRRLQKASSDALDSPALVKSLAAVGVTVVAPERRTPEYLAKFIPVEIEKWAGPIKATGVQGGMSGAR
jgi:tripartite-type tricarboxylate transporter receptor subunit TctC